MVRVNSKLFMENKEFRLVWQQLVAGVGWGG